MRSVVLIAVVLLACVVATPASAAELDQSNIYVEDVERAQRGLERAQARIAEANREVALTQAQLPAADAEARRLRAVADRRYDWAASATRRADRAEAAVNALRDQALEFVQAAQSRQSVRVREWRDERSLWIAAGALLVGLAVAVALGTWTTALPREGGARDRSANLVATTLGVGVAVYLAGLILLLWALDAWRLSWPAAVAAAAGAMGLIGAVAVGWRYARPLKRAQIIKLVAPAAALVLVAAAPAAVAARTSRPSGERLAAETLRLAQQADSEAVMPPAVRRLRTRANAVNVRSEGSARRAEDAEAERVELERRNAEAATEKDDAASALTMWTKRMASAREDYDSYPELSEPEEFDSGEDPLDDLPELPDPPEYEPPEDAPYPDSGPPTTEDFGEGQGRIGRCADGTLSDSIGRPGACSHHGGVG